ncbi:hypothetical protein DPEC_G00028570 [Dallia pectoralis]|uniref:Uncharacterized protein n=1 Tax=Dallia pectoralis TaxID=75939 RepID=A0ACC2HIU0_DALPE|nr:hypothetical protein DPEC_G00028570 [Dallia pectoralis]
MSVRQIRGYGVSRWADELSNATGSLGGLLGSVSPITFVLLPCFREKTHTEPQDEDVRSRPTEDQGSQLPVSADLVGNISPPMI